MTTIPLTIQPKDKSDQSRWREQALRSRLLRGDHVEDVRDEIVSLFAKEIAADLEINPDISRNTAKSVWQQLNTIYQEPPEVKIQEDADLGPVVTPRLWAQQQSTALLAIAMGEALVRLDFKHWVKAEEVEYRVVPAEQVVITAKNGAPDQPARVEELRSRGGVWTWEIWDVTDPAQPVFKIEEIDGGKRVDATAKWAPHLDGQYPYRDRQGDPILPYVLYHKRVGSRLWNWTEGSELVRGTLRLAAHWTNFGESFTSAAFPQRWALDVDSQAGTTRNIGGTPTEVITADRKSIIRFTSKGPSGGTLGQFQSAMDPVAAAAALQAYEQGLATYAGLSPSDLVVSQASSGIAIQVSRAGLRAQQKKIEPSFRMADQQLLATAARLANFYLGGTLPEDPRNYSINYRALGQTLEERKALADSLKAEVELGVISQLDLLRQLRPEIETDEEALDRLVSIRQNELDIEGIRQIQANEAGIADKSQANDLGIAINELGIAVDAEDVAPPPADNVQLTALNGAQVTAAQGIVESVALGGLPRGSGVQMLHAFFNLPIEAAERIMGTVGGSFHAPTETNDNQ